jgi:hypothetical protein
MKKRKLLGWAFIALASITSCTNNTEEILTQECEIRLTSEITPSRVTSLDYQSTQIVKGQQVGITITGAKTEHKNVAWAAGENGSLTNTGEPIYWKNSDVTITAYHPYEKYWTGTNHTFSVSTDQSIEANYLKSDLLWATATSAMTENAVPLTFSHKLAKINVTLVPEYAETDLSGATIYICGTNITTQFNPTTGELTSSTTANVQEIKAAVTADGAYTASAIVIPQALAVGTQFIRVVHGNRIYSYKVGSEGQELKAGYSHNYTLTVKEKLVEVELISSNITNWMPENYTDVIEEDDVLSWFNPNKYITYVANYEYVVTGDITIEDVDITHYRSRIVCPVTISRMEMKYKMNESTNSPYIYLCCANNAKDDYDAISLIKDGIAIETREGDYKTYAWNNLNASITDCMVFEISFKDDYVKLNGAEFTLPFTSTNSFSPRYFFSSYCSENDEGHWLSWSGVPEGSKLYYIKVWDENDNLIYLGGASSSLNPNTNVEENCWKSYYKGSIKYEFPHYSTELTNYQPYGGGID